MSEKEVVGMEELQSGEQYIKEPVGLSKMEIRQEGFETKEERDKTYRILKGQGFKLRRWALRNQEIGYSGFGTERDMGRRADLFKRFGSIGQKFSVR